MFFFFFGGGVWGMECYNFVKIEVSCRLNFSHSLVSYLFVLGDFADCVQVSIWDSD